LENPYERESAQTILAAARLESSQSIHSSLPSKKFGVPSIRKSLGIPSVVNLKKAYAVGPSLKEGYQSALFGVGNKTSYTHL